MSAATYQKFAEFQDDLEQLQQAVTSFKFYDVKTRKAAWPQLRARALGFEAKHDVKIEFGPTWQQQIEADQ